MCLFILPLCFRFTSLNWRNSTTDHKHHHRQHQQLINIIVIMGCMNTTPALPNIHIIEHGIQTQDVVADNDQGISTVSYSPRKSITVKRGNEINAGLLNIYYRSQSKINKNSRYSRQKPKRSRQSGRLTPSRMDFDNISISSIMSTNSSGNISPASLDLSAITDSHKHFNFPRWGHYKKCTFCGCQSHSPNKDNNRKHGGSRKGTLRKQNNQKLPSKDEDNGGRCAMAFANLLAMVRPIFSLSVLKIQEIVVSLECKMICHWWYFRCIFVFLERWSLFSSCQGTW